MNKRQRQLAKAGKYPFKKRVQIWNAGFEFAKYIHGGLIQFKKLPPQSYPDEAGSYENWLKLLDEMIWTFREISLDYPGDPISIALDQMYDRHPDADKYHFEKVTGPNGKPMYQMIEDHPDYASTEVFTKDNEAAAKAYRERIQNGLQLFAKYMPQLWD